MLVDTAPSMARAQTLPDHAQHAHCARPQSAAGTAAHFHDHPDAGRLLYHTGLANSASASTSQQHDSLHRLPTSQEAAAAAAAAAPWTADTNPAPFLPWQQGLASGPVPSSGLPGQRASLNSYSSSLGALGSLRTHVQTGKRSWQEAAGEAARHSMHNGDVPLMQPENAYLQQVSLDSQLQ